MTAERMRTVALVLALLFCCIVAYQNHHLAKELAVVDGGLSGSAELQPGDLVPAFSAKQGSGGIKTIQFGDSHQHRVILIFSTGCKYSMAQISNWWPTLSRELPSSTDLVAVSLEDPIHTNTLLVRKVGHKIEFVSMPDLAIRRAYRVTAVPELLVVSAEGVVEWVHYGLLSVDDYRSLQAYLHSGRKASSISRREKWTWF